jgi:hypothetical protein
MVNVSEPIIETGGFTIGRNRWLALFDIVPFATLEIHPDRLVLYSSLRSFTFLRATLTAISQIRLFFVPCFRIEHAIAEYPRFIVSGSFRPERVRLRLETAGFPVHDAKA